MAEFAAIGVLEGLSLSLAPGGGRNHRRRLGTRRLLGVAPLACLRSCSTAVEPPSEAAGG